MSKTDRFHKNLMKMYENHQRLWNWLADNPGSWKDEWPEWEWRGGKIKRVTEDCFACEWAVRANAYVEYLAKSACVFCPLVWTNQNPACGFIYAQWSDAFGNKSKRIRHALLIANLPLLPELIE